jgi:3-methyl-2-oxobutanoate hydroxymethyltransferase
MQQSYAPGYLTVPSDTKGMQVTLPMLAEKKRLSEPLVMVTAYDYPSARAAQAAGVDVVLVGDSGAQTMLGYPSTVAISADELLMLARAVRRGLQTPLMVGDLPFGSYEASDEQAVITATRFVKDAGCDAVKLERGNETSVARARAIVQAGIPVMGHVGLTPQTATALGGYRAQGRTTGAAMRLAHEALALQQAGCFALVLEAIPAAVCAELVPRIEVPVIGIGAGPATDGQVLVFHDLLGIREGRGARFVKRYADLQDEMNRGVAAYADDVRQRRFPSTEHTYSIPDDELAQFRVDLDAVVWPPLPTAPL